MTDYTGDIGPWLSKYALPAQAGIVTVTHDMAGDWLDYRSRPGTAHQRKLVRAKVDTYTAEMNAGRWRTNPQGLIFDTDGWMFNGQTRMQALRNSVLESLDFWVFPDEAADLFALVDTPAVRRAHQLYNGKYASLVTAAPRYLLPGKVGVYATSMTVDGQLAEVAKWPELATHAPLVQLAQQRTHIPGGAHLAILAQAERTRHRDRIGEWLTGLNYGFDIPPGDPRGHIRNQFMAAHARRREPALVYNRLAKAWNAHVRDERMQVLSWQANEGTIDIVGFDKETMSAATDA